MQCVAMLIAEARAANPAVNCTLSIWLQIMDMLMLAARVAAQFQYDRSRTTTEECTSSPSTDTDSGSSSVYFVPVSRTLCVSAILCREGVGGGGPGGVQDLLPQTA